MNKEDLILQKSVGFHCVQPNLRVFYELPCVQITMGFTKL